MKFLCLSILLLVAISSNAQWLTLAPLNTARQEMPSVVLNGKIYCTGGISSSLATLKSMEIYDPAANSWSSGPDMPATLHHHAMAVLNGKIYVMGGYSDVLFTPAGGVYMYDPDSLKWFIKQNLPVPIGAADAVTYNGNIYFFGGKDASGALSTTLQYDPLFDSWNQKADMSVPREHLCVALVDSLVYVIAGRGSSGSDTAVEIYNIHSNTWSPAPHLPTARSGCDAAAANGKIFVMGGEGGSLHSENEMYDPASNTWSTQAVMPHGRHGLSVVTIGDTVYAIGGGIQQGFGPCDFNEAFITTSATAVNEVREEQRDFRCYYDRRNRELTIQFHSENLEHTQITLFDLQGRIIRREFLSGYLQIQLKDLALTPGYYVVQLESNGWLSAKKFVVD